MTMDEELEDIKDQLTERELLIARAAARIAIKELSDDFYKSIGRNVVQRWLIYVGLLSAGWFGGKGWFSGFLK